MLAIASAALAQPPASLAAAPVHLSTGQPEDLARLLDAGINVVRDCGGELPQLQEWRDEIAAGRRRGPRIYLSGPMLDGPKPDARYRITVKTQEEGERAVDSLAGRVDFIKTHNGIWRETFLAIVRRARHHGLKVAAHLPGDVPAWTAADAGVASIEHAAESLLASPISAGLAKDVPGAVAWWESDAGEDAIRRLAKSRVTIVPTLVRYAASIRAASSPELREGRAALMPKLLALVGRLHAAGVPILAGSDLVGLEGAPPPASGPGREVELLQAAGLSPSAARDAASPHALERWFRTSLANWLMSDPAGSRSAFFEGEHHRDRGTRGVEGCTCCDSENVAATSRSTRTAPRAKRSVASAKGPQRGPT